MKLTARDLQMFAAVGVSANTVALAQVRRVTHEEARFVCGLRYRSDHLEGLAFPYLTPHDHRVVAWRVRRDHPEVEADGTPIAKYISSPDRKHLYFGPDSAAKLADTTTSVIIVESEKAVLALLEAEGRTGRRPALLIGCGGCWGWRGVIGTTTNATGVRVPQKGVVPDVDKVVWAGRDTIIIFDSNAVTNDKVQAARRALTTELEKRGAKVWVVDVPVEPGLNGPDDHVGRHGAAAFWTLVDAAKPAAANKAKVEKKDSPATTIVELIVRSGAELWHTAAGDAYATVSINGHQEHYPLSSRAARDYLSRLFYQHDGKAPNASALQDAINTLSGIARFDGDAHDAHVRVARDGDRFYLDLGDPAWRAVEITAHGWQVVDRPTVRFRRPRGLLPLPVPIRGGSIAELQPFLNIANNDAFVLMTMWALAMFRPHGPYPILIFMAEQGSAKTTTTRVLRRLVDPNEADVRCPPRCTEDLMIAASNGHVVAFDNLSRLSDEFSDNLSVLATGGGFAVRQLYTNHEEAIFNATKPIILSGISQVATRGDLLDRAIVITLPPIPDSQRKDEEVFWRDFETARPRILGAFLDAVVVGLQRLPYVRLERKPRMADFAMWGVATEPACPWTEPVFFNAYAANRTDAIEATLDGDHLVDAVKLLTPWEGTASELLQAITLKMPDSITNRKDWYSKPRQVSDALRRLAPGLRGIGIDVLFSKQGHGRKRLIHIRRFDSSASSASSASPISFAESADALRMNADPGASSSAGSSARTTNVFRLQDPAGAADAREHPFSEGGGWCPPGLGGVNGKF